jgi:hypothetical protein
MMLMNLIFSILVTVTSLQLHKHTVVHAQQIESNIVSKVVRQDTSSTESSITNTSVSEDAEGALNVNDATVIIPRPPLANAMYVLFPYSTSIYLLMTLTQVFPFLSYLLQPLS